VNHRIPVIAGAGSNDTAHAVFMSKELEEKGVDGLLLVTPYYNKCTQKGLIQHYTKIADSVNIPIILYSVAGRTGVNISPSTVFELAKHPKIVGLKEASGNISQVVEIAKCISDDFALYSGNDDMVVPLLSVGGSGVISVVSNVIPKDTHDMVMKYLSGDVKGAGKLQLDMKHLIDALFIEVNPIPVKAALNMMSMIELEYRLPLCPPDEKSMEIIRKELAAYGLI
jgi:4-hydroxy-tetrahydrodipicolinate synthase